MTMTAPVTKQNVKNESTAELTCVCAMKCTTGLNVHMYLLDFKGPMYIVLRNKPIQHIL